LSPGNFVSRHRVDGVGIDQFVDHHQVPAGSCVAKDHRASGRCTDVFIDYVFKHFFNFFSRNLVLGAMLNVSVWVVVEVSDNGIERHAQLARVLYYITTLQWKSQGGSSCRIAAAIGFQWQR
jgi:hypothetical protein